LELNSELAKVIFFLKHYKHDPICLRNSKRRRKPRRNKRVELEVQATSTLRTLNSPEAFYFYEALGKSTGENVASLSDFLEPIFFFLFP
jgi:hypothetical protein